jgi:hypothetical protein
MNKNGRCPAGQYYCYTDKKCKPIPKGFKTVGPAGMLRKENGHTVDDNDSDAKKNGNGNGANGNGGTVSEEGLRDWFGKSKSKDGKPGWVQSDGSPCANEPGEKGTPKCYSSAKKASMSKKELRSADARKSRQDPNQQSKSGAAKPTYVPTDKPKKKMKEETFNEAEDKKTKGSGTKDACYSKVKSRYSVWPSAYASGALVKCRKVGAANWGNSTKKEEFEGFYDLPAFTESQIAAMKYAGIEVEVIDEACWKGYEKKGMKTMFGKRYPNCVKKEEVTGGILVQDAQDFKPREIESVDIIKPEPIKGGQLQEVVRTKVQTGNMYQVIFGWRGKMMMVKLFFPDASVPNRQKVANALDKMYPGSLLRSYTMSVVDYDDPYINVGVDEETDVNQDVQNRMQVDENRKRTLIRNKHRASRLKQNKSLQAEENIEEATPAWQRSAGKNKKGGLNDAGRKSYERDNPGSDLKRPSKVKGNKRRDSFCRRMKGMKAKLTSAKTARDPDSRINKSLRAWDCN